MGDMAGGGGMEWEWGRNILTDLCLGKPSAGRERLGGERKLIKEVAIGVHSGGRGIRGPPCV